MIEISIKNKGRETHKAVIHTRNGGSANVDFFLVDRTEAWSSTVYSDSEKDLYTEVMAELVQEH